MHVLLVESWTGKSASGEAVGREGKGPEAMLWEDPSSEGGGRKSQDAEAKQWVEEEVGWKPVSEGPKKLSVCMVLKSWYSKDFYIPRSI